ncbi:MAG: hypothetical protein HYZ83_05420, partial [Candidatus Omnitrophica bacterium]|nr:hypothetical protein [Candidatus Omnitrophota bacterium]
DRANSNGILAKMEKYNLDIEDFMQLLEGIKTYRDRFEALYEFARKYSEEPMTDQIKDMYRALHQKGLIIEGLAVYIDRKTPGIYFGVEEYFRPNEDRGIANDRLRRAAENAGKAISDLQRLVENVYQDRRAAQEYMVRKLKATNKIDDNETVESLGIASLMIPDALEKLVKDHQLNEKEALDLSIEAYQKPHLKQYQSEFGMWWRDFRRQVEDSDWTQWMPRSWGGGAKIIALTVLSAGIFGLIFFFLGGVDKKLRAWFKNRQKAAFQKLRRETQATQPTLETQEIKPIEQISEVREGQPAEIAVEPADTQAQQDGHETKTDKPDDQGINPDAAARSEIRKAKAPKESHAEREGKFSLIKVLAIPILVAFSLGLMLTLGMLMGQLGVVAGAADFAKMSLMGRVEIARQIFLGIAAQRIGQWETGYSLLWGLEWLFWFRFSYEFALWVKEGGWKTIRFSFKSQKDIEGKGSSWFAAGDLNIQALRSSLQANKQQNVVVLEQLATTADRLKDVTEKDFVEAFNAILKMTNFHTRIDIDRYKTNLAKEPQELLQRAQETEPKLSEAEYLTLNTALLQVIYPREIQKNKNKNLMYEYEESVKRSRMRAYTSIVTLSQALLTTIYEALTLALFDSSPLFIAFQVAVYAFINKPFRQLLAAFLIRPGVKKVLDNIHAYVANEDNETRLSRSMLSGDIGVMKNNSPAEAAEAMRNRALEYMNNIKMVEEYDRETNKPTGKMIPDPNDHMKLEFASGSTDPDTLVEEARQLLELIRIFGPKKVTYFHAEENFAAKLGAMQRVKQFLAEAIMHPMTFISEKFDERRWEAYMMTENGQQVRRRMIQIQEKNKFYVVEKENVGFKDKDGETHFIHDAEIESEELYLDELGAPVYRRFGGGNILRYAPGKDHLDADKARDLEVGQGQKVFFDYQRGLFVDPETRDPYEGGNWFLNYGLRKVKIKFLEGKDDETGENFVLQILPSGDMIRFNSRQEAYRANADQYDLVFRNLNGEVAYRMHRGALYRGDQDPLAAGATPLAAPGTIKYHPEHKAFIKAGTENTESPEFAAGLEQNLSIEPEYRGELGRFYVDGKEPHEREQKEIFVKDGDWQKRGLSSILYQKQSNGSFVKARDQDEQEIGEVRSVPTFSLQKMGFMRSTIDSSIVLGQGPQGEPKVSAYRSTDWGDFFSKGTTARVTAMGDNYESPSMLEELDLIDLRTQRKVRFAFVDIMRGRYEWNRGFAGGAGILYVTAANGKTIELEVSQNGELMGPNGEVIASKLKQVSEHDLKAFALNLVESYSRKYGAAVLIDEMGEPEKENQPKTLRFFRQGKETRTIEPFQKGDATRQHKFQLHDYGYFYAYASGDKQDQLVTIDEKGTLLQGMQIGRDYRRDESQEFFGFDPRLLERAGFSAEAIETAQSGVIGDTSDLHLGKLGKAHQYLIPQGDAAVQNMKNSRNELLARSVFYFEDNKWRLGYLVDSDDHFEVKDGKIMRHGQLVSENFQELELSDDAVNNVKRLKFKDRDADQLESYIYEETYRGKYLFSD